MFWKVYAVFYLVLIVLGLPPALNRLPHMSPIDLVDMIVFTPVALAGLWSVAFRHISLPTNTWKVLLFVSVFWRAIAVGNAILFGDIVPRLQTGLHAYAARMDPVYSPVMLYGGLVIAFLAGAFLTLPPLIGLYRNAYGNESLLRLMYSPMRSRQTVA
ncbi:MAG TPA: hypothetical protein VHN39_08665 [Phenylobacterium sp.]|jgi:hypothetical protein|nr:hypothetical protein [Phenylobacterium sp.]